MKINKFCYLILLLIICSCDKSETVQNEQDGEGKLLWTSPISDGSLVNGVFYNHVHNDRLYVLGSKDGKATIMTKGVNDGETDMEWSDWGHSQTILIYNLAFTTNEEMLAFSNSFYYKVDVTNGNTVFSENAYDVGTNFFYSLNPIILENSLYHVGNSFLSSTDSIFYSVFRRDLITDELEEFVLPNYTRQTKNLRNEVGNIMRLTGFEYNGKPKLLLSIMEIDSLWDSLGYISLYDVESQTWDYEMAELDYDFQENYTGNPIISGDYVYHTKGRLATCHNVLTGELIWKQNLRFTIYSGGTSIGGFVISEEDNIMVVSTHSGERLTYGLDMTTGDIVWQTETTGGNGQKYALNGVVYFASYGDGELHALDIATGDYIWKIESPDSSSDNWFQGVLTGIPGENGEKGKIFTNSYTNVFCFEAAR